MNSGQRTAAHETEIIMQELDEIMPNRPDKGRFDGIGACLDKSGKGDFLADVHSFLCYGRIQDALDVLTAALEAPSAGEQFSRLPGGCDFFESIRCRLATLASRSAATS